MNEKSGIPKSRLSLVLFSLVFLLSSLLHCSGPNGFFRSEAWNTGWKARFLTYEELQTFRPETEQWQSNYLNYSIPFFSIEEPNDGIFLVRKTIDSSLVFDHPTLLVRGGANLISAFVGSQKIADFVQIEKNAAGVLVPTYNPTFSPFLALPKDLHGKEIFLLFYKYKNYPAGFSEPPVFADQLTAFRMMSGHNQMYSGLGFFFLTLSLFAIYLYLRRQKKAILAFIGFSGIAGLQFFSQVGFFGLFWYDSLPQIFFLYLVTLLLLPAAGLYFFDKLFGVGKWNVIRMLWQFHIFFDVLFLFFNYLGYLPFSLTLKLYGWLLLPTLLVQMFVVWGEIAVGKPRAWVLGWGSVLLLVFNVHDILANFGYIQSVDRFSAWGFFGFILSLSLYGETVFRDSEVKYASLQKEIVTAARIQNAILPPNPPHWEKVQVAVHYQPSTDVGGDFYDFQALGGERYSVLIADVVGHGLGASVIASLSKFAFFQHHKQWSSPSFLLENMNEYLVKRSQGRFTTATYFFLNKAKMTYTVSSAGHPSFFHWEKKSQSLLERKPKGKPLGILDHITYSEEEYPFALGDRFLFYTDGLTEENDLLGREFGSERLGDLFQKHSPLPIEEVVSLILGELQRFTGFSKNPTDDITLILLEVQD